MCHMYMTDFAYEGPIVLVPISLSYPSSPVFRSDLCYCLILCWCVLPYETMCWRVPFRDTPSFSTIIQICIYSNQFYLITLFLSEYFVRLYVSLSSISSAHHLSVKRLKFRPVTGCLGDDSLPHILQLASCGADNIVKVYNIDMRTIS